MKNFNNKSLLCLIESVFQKNLSVALGRNKKNEIIRLLFEICQREGKTPDEVLKEVGFESVAFYEKGGLFHKLKKALLALRFTSYVVGRDPRLYPLKIRDIDTECNAWKGELRPARIFIENNIKNKKWVEGFVSKFPGAAIRFIETVKEAAGHFSGNSRLEKYNDRRKNIFLINNKDAFLKVCPCTKGAVRCGYWVLNIGFGCPIDCSYCFLQLYSNSPGMILPANVDDYFEHIMGFDSRVPARTRIGTGEFTDSLALDKYTGYSSLLVPFFKKTKNLVLELKTKISDIDTVLALEPNENVVLSWSVNPDNIAKSYEKGGASIAERISAAERAAKRGYRVGFHFDPVIHSPDWEAKYRKLIEDIFSSDMIRRKTEWISLGTLRYTPGLKQVAEQRFEDNLIYYWGDFFEGENGKMRYTFDRRVAIYRKMIKWLNKYNIGAWIYLCMEPGDIWERVGLKNKQYS